MVAHVLKRVAARLPESIQHELRRLFFRRQIHAGRFVTDEQEYKELDRFISPGDYSISAPTWVITRCACPHWSVGTVE